MKLGQLLGREGQYELYKKVAPEMFKVKKDRKQVNRVIRRATYNVSNL